MRQGVTGVLVALAWLGGIGLPECGAGAVSLPDSTLGYRMAPLLLLSRRDVQADLKLSREQVDGSARALADLHARAMHLRGMKGEQAVAARRAIDEQHQRWLETSLTDQQKSRLAQIDLQWEGASALVNRPTMSESLRLSDEQRSALRKLVQQSRAERSRGDDPLAVERRLSNEVLKTLTDPQKQLWKVMLGRPFQPELAGAHANAP